MLWCGHGIHTLEMVAVHQIVFCRVPVSRCFTILGQRHRFKVVGGAQVALVLASVCRGVAFAFK
jgi:hypothetical protein